MRGVAVILAVLASSVSGDDGGADPPYPSPVYEEGPYSGFPQNPYPGADPFVDYAVYRGQVRCQYTP